MCADLFNKLLHRSEEEGSFSEEQKQKGVNLSIRELEILNLIAEGHTNAEIAKKLSVSKRTVETHRLNILEKTNSKNTAHLIKCSIKNGYIRVS